MRYAPCFSFVAAALAAGCGGSTSPDPPPGADASAMDGGGDASDTDGSLTDGSPASDGGGGACNAACAPDFCGCGTCDATRIVCTTTPPACPLGCASQCPELETVTCHCESDRCVRDGAKPGDVTACYSSHDCPLGQCCVATGGITAGRCAPDGDPGCTK